MIKNNSGEKSRYARLNLVLLGFLYLAELSVLAILMSVYRLSDKPNGVSLLFSRPGALILVAGSSFALSGGAIIYQFVKSLRAGSRKEYFLTLSMNLVVVLMIVGVGELSLRILSMKTPMGITIGGKLLYPREWQDVAARHLRAIEKAAIQKSYTVFDGRLGWTIGPNRSSENGLYFSSVNGLRSPRPGVDFADRPASCRIALLGDSFTFGDEVAFEDTWGHQLELSLGKKCQVLNFGVPGYGVDQAYLRYMQDVQSWRPDVVILAFVNHDIERTLSLYAFLLFPNATVPFAKPRFILTGDRLSIVNTPLPQPHDIFSRASIQELPFISYDRAYKQTEWDRPSWRFSNYFYMFRLLISLYPLWELEREHVSNRALKSINLEIIRSFVRENSSAGSIPIIVFLPVLVDLPHSETSVSPGVKILQDGRIPHVDLRSCLNQDPVSRYFMPAGEGEHYSPEGNRQIARCIRDVLAPQLPRRMDSPRH